jgi:pyridoxamine 5'-phosphate oxidase
MEDPIALFEAWLDDARQHEPEEAEAMSVATVDKEGRPSLRMVLVRGVDQRGFVFYTNLNSRKSAELVANSAAALCWHWKSTGRQVRVEGFAEPVSEAEADAYFASRPRESRIGAWASKQSRELENRATLEQRFEDYAAKFPGETVPRPEFWSGFRVVPRRIEFWAKGEFRLHERRLFERQGDRWQMMWLYP